MQEQSQTMPQSCGVALKEWAATNRALADGVQLLLLRKGGILDEDGVFQLEHREFWLFSTFEHQDATLVKPQYRDLLAHSKAQPGENRQFASLQFWARVEGVWALNENDDAALRQAPHIWSGNYLDLRFGYKPERPLLACALRLYKLPQPHRIEMQPEFSGCRSWISLRESLSLGGAQPALSDADFSARLRNLEQLLP